MPYVLKPNELFVRDTSNGGYLPQNVIATQTADEQITLVEDAGAEEIADIRAAGAGTIADVEQAVSDSQAAVADIETRKDEIIADVQQAVADSQAAVASIDSQRDTMIEAIARIAGQGTDPTLSQSGVAADAAACGDLKSALEKDSGIKLFNWTIGKYYQTGSTVTTIDVANPTGESAKYACAYFPCSEGDVVHVKSYGGSGSRCWAFLSSADGENNILLRETSAISQAGVDKAVTAPEGTAYVIVNADIRHDYEAIFGQYIIDRVEEIESCLAEQGDAWEE